MNKKTTWIALAAAAVLLVAGLWLVFFGPFARQREGQRTLQSIEPQGEGPRQKWMYDLPGDPNKGRIQLTTVGAPFGDGGELIWNTTFEVKGDTARRQGFVSRYNAQASGEGKVTVTMLSKQLPGEGIERIDAAEKRPQTWDFQRKGDGVLEIRRSFAGNATVFRFRKED